MKVKIFVFLFLSLSLLGLTACQNKQEINAETIKMNALSQEKRMGVIQDLGGAMNSNQATHLLRMENGKTIFLKSTVIELGSEKYQKRDVEISGNLIRTTNGEQVMNVQSIDLIEKESMSDFTLPQWKDYESTKLGLKFKYRDDLQLVEKTDQLILTGKTKKLDDGGVQVIENDIDSPVLGVDEYTMTIMFKLLSSQPDFDLLALLGLPSDSSANLLSKGLSKSKITTKALDAYKESDKTGNNIAYYVKTDQGAYLIKIEINKSDNVIQDQNLFYDILASVDFSHAAEPESVN